MNAINNEPSGYFAVSTNERFLSEVDERLASVPLHPNRTGERPALPDGELTRAERERYRWRSLQGLAWRDW